MKQANNKAEHIITVLLSNSELTKEDLPTTFTIYHKDRYHLFQEGRPRILGVIHITFGFLSLTFLYFCISHDMIFIFFIPSYVLSILSGILGVCSSFFRKTCIVKWFLAISVICSVFIFLLFAVSILLMVDIKETYSTYEIKMQLEIIAVLGVFNILEFINCIVSCCFASKGVCRDDFNSQPVVYLEYQSQSASRQNQEHIETSL
ncbi:uncharacterized protein LOC120536778 isoform X1 [Polypterus senegalus]|uniref:uncharacterized protein LOC120536778 isoform X1 n=1 Tax=Polypterus senegalus TaxID=55291 RepID=UPI00196526F6|nr:uncharacterized protein LOC120536778 isoform X1 [Polypterus senegalus]XP_039621194.1 uncharacterized protein LOC120536778 isoform X1 [Polypterus senegalus]